MKFLGSREARILGTGAMLLLAIGVLISASELYVRQKVPVSLSGYQVSVDLWSKGHIGLKGTWVAENGDSAIPLQLSTVTCNTGSKKCIESRALVTDARQLSVEQDSYEITHWDDHSLVYSSSAQCVESVFTVNRDTGQATGVVKMKEGPEDQCPARKDELKLKLADAADVYRQVLKKARPVLFNLAGLVIILLWTGLRIQKIKKSSPHTNPAERV